MNDINNPNVIPEPTAASLRPAGQLLDQSNLGAAPSADQTSHETELVEYLKVFHKRRRLVAAVFVPVFVAAVLYAYTTTPEYDASVKILIEPAQYGEKSYVGDKGAQESYQVDYYQTQYDLLKSRAVARRTIDTLNLWDRYTAPPKQSWQDWVQALFVSSANASTASPSSTPATPSTLPETVPQSRAINSVLSMISISPVRNSRVVDLTVSSTDPRLAMEMANAHANAYVNQNLEFRFTASKEVSAWLTARLAEQRELMEAADNKLQQYREQHALLPVEDSTNILGQKLAQLNTAVTSAKTTTLQREALYEQVKSAAQQDPGALDAFPVILNNSYIQSQRAELAGYLRQEAELAQKFGENHPQLKTLRTSIQVTRAKVQNEINNVVLGLKTDFETARVQEDSLNRALQAQNQEALAMNRTGIEFSVLKRNAESARLVYQAMLQRTNETGVASQMNSTNVRIIDLAPLPRLPARPNRQLIALVGLGGGLILAACVGLMVEYMDNRIKTPDEIKQYLGVPSLGLLPIVDAGESLHTYPLLDGGSWPRLNEAFRTLRTNVIFSFAEEGATSVVVTSTGPGEGKTLVATNLAIALAEIGLRVLLIDADMRRPKLHTIFAIDPEPGLSNLMVANAKASEAVRKGTVPGLWVLPAGRIPPNPAELLGSTRFAEFVKSLGAQFDWIIIDSPPVMAVADASIASHVASGVVFVVGAEMVSRNGARAALEQLHNARSNVIGAILNRVDLDRNAYYYSQYYRREYSDYYTTPSARA